jgi:hypothetical protein
LSSYGSRHGCPDRSPDQPCGDYSDVEPAHEQSEYRCEENVTESERFFSTEMNEKECTAH